MEKIVIVLLLLSAPFIHGCGDNPYTQQLADLKAEYASGRMDFYEYFYRWYELIRNMVVYYCELFLNNMFKWFPWLHKLNTEVKSVSNADIHNNFDRITDLSFLK